MFCTFHVFFLFLLCCNASTFVICAIKNYLLTYLNPISSSKFIQSQLQNEQSDDELQHLTNAHVVSHRY